MQSKKKAKKGKCSTWNTERKDSAHSLAKSAKSSTWNNEERSERFAEAIESCFQAVKQVGEETVKQTAKADLSDKLEVFKLYYNLLLKWNRSINLTRITDPDKAAKLLFLDSAVAVDVLLEHDKVLAKLDNIDKSTKPDKPISVLDVGSGAGFPGLVLAIMLPEFEFELLDNSFKRVAFLNEVIIKCSLSNVSASHGRWPEDIHRQYDWVLSRAVFSSLDAWKNSAKALNKGGKLLLWRTDADIEVPGFALEKIRYSIPGLEKSRMLLICKEKTDDHKNNSDS